jgi:chromosomal replication initiation ATPase DnaA
MTQHTPDTAPDAAAGATGEGPQLVFDFPARPALGRADFLVAPCNAEAVAWVDRWPDWPGPALALVGPEGSGKTHLAHVLAARAGAVLLAPPDAEDLDAAVADGLFAPHGARAAVVEMPPGDPAPGAAVETALFHLLNMAREQGGHVLLTAEVAPARWPVALPDLRSRLSALPVAEITPPDLVLLEMVLVKLFADRQVVVGPEVVRYLARRMERSFAAARAVVARLDAMAWTRGRPITLPLARTLLQSGG